MTKSISPAPAVGSLAAIADADLRAGLSVCLQVPRWIDDLVAAGPYDSVAALSAAAYQAATPLSAAEVDQALSAHPRIGERAKGDSPAARLSKAEQSASAAADPVLEQELVAGNRAYEARFGRVFLIRAAGRSRPEILAELSRRLELSATDEIVVVGSELRDIAIRRIPQVFAGYR